MRQLIATRKQELAEGAESIEKQQADNKTQEEKLNGLQEHREENNKTISELTQEQQKVS